MKKVKILSALDRLNISDFLSNILRIKGHFVGLKYLKLVISCIFGLSWSKVNQSGLS